MLDLYQAHGAMHIENGTLQELCLFQGSNMAIIHTQRLPSDSLISLRRETSEL